MAESVQTQLERAQDILDLLSAEEWVTSDTIAQHVGQSRKSAKLYVDRLRKMGHGINSARGKGYRLEARDGEGRLLLAEDEMLALFLSLERSSTDFPAPLLERLKRRLLNLLSKTRREQARVFETTRDESSRSFFVSLDTVKVITRARETGRLLRVVYQGLKDEAPRHRVVQPLRFKPKPQAWYLEVWDIEEGKEKSFRLDRITDAICLAEKARVRPEEVNIAHHPWDFGSHPLTASIKVRPDLARWLDENPAHPSQRSTPLGCGNFAIEYEIRSPGKFLDWLMGLRGFELLGPESLVKRLRERSETLFKTLGTLTVPWEVSSK